MQWMNLPPKEQFDLEKFVDGHCHTLHVKKVKALFIGIAWLLPMKQKISIIFKKLCVVTQ